ncbi:DsbE family thiol:disulfide interchange protein, partial [Agrobacterium sp. S2]|nr:DsbE family thiol:disulfide interchange protein [Agrobacterium sp. S2]
MTQTNQNDASKSRSSGRARYALALLPLLLFGGFALVAGKMLYDQDVNGLDVSAIPSALIGTRAPTLSLPPLEGSNLP